MYVCIGFMTTLVLLTAFGCKVAASGGELLLCGLERYCNFAPQSVNSANRWVVHYTLSNCHSLHEQIIMFARTQQGMFCAARNSVSRSKLLALPRTGADLRSRPARSNEPLARNELMTVGNTVSAETESKIYM